MQNLCAAVWHGLNQIMLQLKNPVVFDLGGNEGGMTGMFLDQGASHVHLFEPVPDMVEKARQRFSGDGRVTINAVAVGDVEGELSGVNVFNTWTLLPQGSPGAMALDYANKPPFSVPIITLDAYVKKTGAVPDFIKLDVDGYELRVLKGAMNTLQLHHPPMIFEYSFLPGLIGDSVDEMAMLIYRLGYRAVSMDGRCECFSPQQMLDQFPAHTSFDIMLLPRNVSFPVMP